METKIIIVNIIFFVMLVMFVFVLWVAMKAAYESQEMIDDMNAIQSDSDAKVKAIYESAVIELKQLKK